MKSKENKKRQDSDDITEPKGAIKWILEILFILLLIPIATISYKAADPFRHNEKIPESLRDFATSDFMGIQPYIVVSNSMQGSASDDFNAGDLVIAMVTTADDIKEGDVVSYTVGDPLDRYIVIHRVLTDNGDGTYIFKGDANNVQDANPVSADQIQAKYVFHIAKLGFVIQFIGEHRIQIVLAIVAVYCVFAVVDAIKDDDDDEDEEDNASEDTVDDTTEEATVEKEVIETEEFKKEPTEEKTESIEVVEEEKPTVAENEPVEKLHTAKPRKAINEDGEELEPVEELSEEVLKAIDENSKGGE